MIAAAIQWIILVNLYTACMLVLYRTFLYGKGYLALSRAYLLLALVLPLLLPFLRMTMPQFLPETPVTVEQMLPEVLVQPATAAKKVYSPEMLFMAGYVLVAAVLLLRAALQYLKVGLWLKKQKAERHNGYRLYRNTGAGAGSIFGAVFIPGEAVSDDILAHEEAHIRLRHSWDILFCSVVQALCWPCLPAGHLRRELQLVHEFQADRLAVAKAQNDYAGQLLNNIFSTQAFGPVHLFSSHPLKRRIDMLRAKTTNRGLARTTAAVLLFTALFSGMALWAQQAKKGKGKAQHAASSKLPDEKGVFSTVDEMPKFKGDITQYLAKNLIYPQEARDNAVEGRVVVKFVVDKTGKAGNATVVRSAHEALDKEALRVIETLPDFTPGKMNGKVVDCYFMMPISFRLDGEAPAAPPTPPTPPTPKTDAAPAAPPAPPVNPSAPAPPAVPLAPKAAAPTTPQSFNPFWQIVKPEERC